jgi:outer membrane protein OmpA-like peptidoglycan-associated protein
MCSENAVTDGQTEAGVVRGRVQATRMAGAPAIGVVALGLAGFLAGCSSMPNALNPVSWWHGLQGGKIAEDRPPPPGDNDPYPNLGTVPARPAASDPKLRAQIADALVADRGNAQHDSAGTQLSDPSNPNSAPALFGRGSARPPAPAPSGGPSATLAATDSTAPSPSSPPPMATERQTGVARAPVGAVRSSPLETSDDAGAENRPALPTAPPAPANLPGAPASAPVPQDRAANPLPDTTFSASAPRPGSPAATAAAAEIAASAPATASSAPQSATPAAGRSVGVPFAAGSATVPRTSLASLRQLANRRGNGTIAVTGYGEATEADTAAQAAALALATARAQAVAGALTTAGVPANAIRVDAEAAGRGAAARLVE